MLAVLGLVAAAPGGVQSGPSAVDRELPGHVERLSIAADGGDSNGPSSLPAVSGDGSVVAFRTMASNIVPGDNNEAADIVVVDRRRGTIEIASVSSTGEQSPKGFGVTDGPSISRDGRYVTFMSHAPNLVPDDNNCATPQPSNWRCGLDVFVRDLLTGTTERVSLTAEGGDTNGLSTHGRISGDGRYVAYMSEATNIVPDYQVRCGLPCGDVYIHDRTTGTTELISTTEDGGNADRLSRLPALSHDGRYVAFHSRAKDLAPGTEANPGLIFLRDRVAGTTELVSMANDGTPGNEEAWASGHPTVSDDGRYVVYSTTASNLVPTKTNNAPGRSRTLGAPGDVYVRDRVAGLTRRLSLSSTAEQGQDGSGAGEPAISADGRRLVFGGESPNLAASQRGPDQFVTDLFLRDIDNGITELLSVNSFGEQATLLSYQPAISADGRFVVFSSLAGNLDPRPDASATEGGDMDVFIRELAPLEGVTGMTAVVAGDRIEARGDVWLSGTPIAAAMDDATDGRTDVGGELTGAEVVYRPGTNDLLVTLSLAELPGVRAPGPAARYPIPPPNVGSPADPLRNVMNQTSSEGGLPGVVYGFSLTARNASTERSVDIRMARVGSDRDRATFELYRCEDTEVCAPSLTLEGGFGTAGDEITVAVPLVEALALVGGTGTQLSELRAYVGAGAPTTGAVQLFDEIELDSTAIPRPRVWLATSAVDAQAPPEDLWSAVDVVGGRFVASLPQSQTPTRVWARACLGATCADDISVAVAGP